MLCSLGYDAYGYEVDGELALKRILQSKPDLLLMDINLQHGIDGAAIVEQLYRVMHIPVIYISAYSRAETIARGAPTQPCGYLTKPINESELKASIEAALGKSPHVEAAGKNGKPG